MSVEVPRYVWVWYFEGEEGGKWWEVEWWKDFAELARERGWWCLGVGKGGLGVGVMVKRYCTRIE
jgi:hypothetical protein